MPLLPVVPPQVHVQFHPARKFLFAQVAVERFLPGVHPDVGLHVSPREVRAVANLADERLELPVHHLEVLGEAEAVDEALAALLADVDAAVAVHPAVPLEALGVREPLPAERAGERSPARVEADVAFQRRQAAEDAAALAALVFQQPPADDRERLQRRYDRRAFDGDGKERDAGGEHQRVIGYKRRRRLSLPRCGRRRLPGRQSGRNPHGSSRTFPHRLAAFCQLARCCAVLQFRPHLGFCRFSQPLGIPPHQRPFGTSGILT